MVPMQLVAKVKRGEDTEDRKSNDLLDHFELIWRESTGPDAVGGNLETVFKEGNGPTDDDDLP